MKKIITLIAFISIPALASAQTEQLNCLQNEYIHINLANKTLANNHLRIEQCSRDVKQGREISYRAFPIDSDKTGHLDFKDNFSDHPEVNVSCTLVDVDPRTGGKTTVGYLQMYADNPCTGVNSFQTLLFDASGLIYDDAPWLVNYVTNGDRSFDWSIDVELKTR